MARRRTFIVLDESRVTRLRTDVPDRDEVAQVKIASDEALTGILDLRE